MTPLKSKIKRMEGFRDDNRALIRSLRDEREALSEEIEKQEFGQDRLTHEIEFLKCEESGGHNIVTTHGGDRVACSKCRHVERDERPHIVLWRKAIMDAASKPTIMSKIMGEGTRLGRVVNIGQFVRISANPDA